MKQPIINHSWESILERDDFAKICLKQKIEQLESIADVIRSKYDESSVISVLDNGKILYALKRALEYLDNPNGFLTEKDFFIYYGYASVEVKKTQNIIDEELSDLGL